MVEKLPRRAARSRCAASRSWIEAAVTTTVSSRPFHIHGEVPLDAVGSLAAIPAAAGSGHGVGGGDRLRVDDRRGRAPVPRRPARTRSRSRSASRMRDHAPPRAQRAKTAYTVPAGGNSTGSCRIPPRCTGWRPLSHGGNASRVVRRGLPCCPAQATAVRGSPTVRRSPTTSTPRNHVRPQRGAGTTGMARSAMMALWAPGLGGDLVSTDPTRELTSSVRREAHARPSRFSNTL